MVGEANTDALAELPMPVLMDWQEYMLMQSSTKPQGVSPATMLEMFRKQYGAK
jgi:hypothetical protein